STPIVLFLRGATGSVTLDLIPLRGPDGGSWAFAGRLLHLTSSQVQTPSPCQPQVTQSEHWYYSLLRLRPSQCSPFRQVSHLPRAYRHILYRRSAQCAADLYPGRVSQSQIPCRGRRSISTRFRLKYIARNASHP